MSVGDTQGFFWDAEYGVEVDYVGLWVCERCYYLLDWECHAMPNFFGQRCCICDGIANYYVVPSILIEDE